MITCPKRFSEPLDKAVVAVLDTESTGIDIGKDEAVEVAIALFQAGKLVDSYSALINPGIHIPAEATAIHGYTDDDVECAPSITDFWRDIPRRFVDDVQFCAYSGFDKHFVPKSAPIDHTWPFIDILAMVRACDPFVRGKGRHKLDVTCQRHGIEIGQAHRALADATAAGHLLYKLHEELREKGTEFDTLGDLIEWTRIKDIESWGQFFRWLAKQPPQQQESTP